jgi:DNA primase
MNTLLDVIDDAEKSGADSWNAPRCPNCGRGEDRLVIWPESGETGQVYCRKCDWGRSTHPSGSIDGIEYMRQAEGMGFREACAFFGVEHKTAGDGAPAGDGAEKSSADESPGVDHDTNCEKGAGWQKYTPPNQQWRTSARLFCTECKKRLWSGSSAALSALNYLEQRGLVERTICNVGLGVNPEERFPKRTEWGLDPKESRRDGGKIWLPQGIVIPWADSEGLSNVDIRRPDGDVDPSGEEGWKGRKYQQAAGKWSPLWGVQWLTPEKPAVLVEGEFDALAVRQEAADLCTPVATGSTGGARRQDWHKKLSDTPFVLVAFDSEESGEKASRVWTAALPNAYRWHPHAGDPAEMLERGKDLRTWVQCGLTAARTAL